jgi:integrase
MATVKFHEGRQRWVIRYYDHTGQQGWETMPKGSTKREALRRRREIEESVEKKTFKRPTQIPLFKEVASQWLEVRSGAIRHTTYAQYKGHVDNHLVPYFGEVKCNEVTADLVERFVGERSKAGMEPNTLNKVITTLSSIMGYASHPNRGYAVNNPVTCIENRPQRIKKEAEMATLDEIHAIMDKMSNPRDKLIVRTMAFTGMREGEIFGLQWGDIQWKDSQICVRRTYNHRRFYEPKSARSKRNIDVSEDLLHELKKWKLACPNGELDLVFPNTHGNPMNATNWLKHVWHPTRRRAGVRHLTPHSLRHFSGSFLLDQGVDIGYVQDHLGHNSIQMTMDTYRHKIRKYNREAAGILGKALFER